MLGVAPGGRAPRVRSLAAGARIELERVRVGGWQGGLATNRTEDAGSTAELATGQRPG